MSRKNAKPCVPVKSTVSLPLKEKPYVHGIFLDAAQTSYDLPLCNVPEVKDPKNVDPNGVYDVFYSEYIAPGTKHRETYPECRKRISYIPKFEAGSDEKGPGLFPATILLTGDTLADMLHQKETFRVRKPSHKIMEKLSSASSSGVSLSTSNHSSSSGRSTGSSQRDVDPSKSSGFLNKNLEGMAQVSNPSQEAEAEKYKQESKKYKESLHNAKRTITKREETISKKEHEIEELRSKIQKLEETNQRLLDLNMRYQEQTLPPRPSGVTNPKSNAIVLETEEIISTNSVDDNLLDLGIGGVIVQVADHVPAAHVNVVQERVVAPPPPPAAPRAEVVQELLVHQPAPTVPDANTIPAAETETVQIHPGVCVNRSVYDEDFKKFLGDPINMRQGQEHDPDFVKDLAEVVFTPEVLATSTVKGKMINARKSDPNYATVDPELCPIKRQAIERALFRRVSIEVEGLDKSTQNTVLKARVQLKLINKWLGEAIHNHKRKQKRAQKSIEKEQRTQ